jgi:hypothetical protein
MEDPHAHDVHEVPTQQQQSVYQHMIAIASAEQPLSPSRCSVSIGWTLKRA